MTPLTRALAWLRRNTWVVGLTLWVLLFTALVVWMICEILPRPM